MKIMDHDIYSNATGGSSMGWGETPWDVGDGAPGGSNAWDSEFLKCCGMIYTGFYLGLLGPGAI